MFLVSRLCTAIPSPSPPDFRVLPLAPCGFHLIPPPPAPPPQEEGQDSPTAAELSKLEEEQVQLKSLLRKDSLLLHSKFHPDWGQLFKSGYQDSRFATQVR